MPVYEFACQDCEAAVDRLLPTGRRDDPGPCGGCGGALTRRFSRVAVRYGSWGFAATDGMVPDRPGRGRFQEVASRAERISEGGA